MLEKGDHLARPLDTVGRTKLLPMKEHGITKNLLQLPSGVGIKANIGSPIGLEMLLTNPQQSLLDHLWHPAPDPMRNNIIKLPQLEKQMRKAMHYQLYIMQANYSYYVSFMT